MSVPGGDALHPPAEGRVEGIPGALSSCVPCHYYITQYEFIRLHENDSQMKISTSLFKQSAL